MRHFDHCQCDKCRPSPMQPAPSPGGVLVQQIVSQGQLQERCRQFCLSLSPLPRILVPPYYIRDVRICGEGSLQSIIACGAEVLLPLSVTVCDQAGNSHAAQASLTASVPLRPSHNTACQYIVQAEAALCQQSPCFEDPQQVGVCLSLCVQVYGVRWRPMHLSAPCAPACLPPLPLYPQPRPIGGI